MEVLKTRIRQELNPRFRELYESNRLEELLIPQPQAAADEILRRIQSNGGGSVNSIFSLSMYSGKTTAAIDLAHKAKENGIQILAVQPNSGLRYGEQQETQIMTHKLQKYETIPAVLTDPNLYSVLKITEEARKNTQAERLVLIIDEAMLYTDHTDNPQEAVEIIEDIRQMGIDIVPTGITRNFKAKPFTVMDRLVQASSEIEGWDFIEMTTQCAFCTERAKGTARYVIENGDIRLATLDEPDVKPGGVNSYLQVCVDVHKSFSA